jgi:gluconokinase
MATSCRRRRVVLCGVAGSGKTTVGRALAATLGEPFLDADEFHPPANLARMRAGLPLDDAARAPWLAAIHARLVAEVAAGHGFVLACSALRRRYRDTLGAGLPPLQFVALQVDPATLRARLQQRSHFFPAALLDSQLAAWEPLADGPAVEATGPLDAVVARIRDHLHTAD